MPKQYFGWGREEWPETKNLWAEAIENEANLNKFGEQRFSQPPPREANPIEEQIRGLFKFDNGWDFYPATRIVNGQVPVIQQVMGNCVGASHALLLCHRISHEILVEGDPEEVLGDFSTSSPVPFIPYSYGCGRCLAGNMCGGGDGSYCSVQLRASMEHGFLPSDTQGLPQPVPQGTAATGRRWGSNRSVLQEWRPKAVLFDLEHSWQVKSFEDIRKAICDDKHPIQICSNWGFRESYQVDLNGEKFWVAKRSGSWAHAMQLTACFEINGKWFVRVTNQWGSGFHKDGPHFHVDEQTMSQWIRQADARTIGEIKGRPSMIGLPM